MLPRFVFLLCLISIACSQGPKSATTSDSTAADSLSGETPAETVVNFQFTNDELFTKLLPFDLSDEDALKEWFPNGGLCEGFDNEDETPWYRTCTYNGPSLSLVYHDFFDSDPQRFFFYEISTASSKVEFALGVHVGMSKREFLDAVKVTDPTAIAASTIWANSSDEKKDIMFQFENDAISLIRFDFDYGDKFPKTVGDFLNEWTEVYEAGEDEPEWHVPCGPLRYRLQGVVVDEETTKYLLDVVYPQDSQTDTVQWIRKTGRGFLVSSFNSFDSYRPRTRRVVFLDSALTLAEWEGKLFASPDFNQPLQQDQCDGEEP